MNALLEALPVPAARGVFRLEFKALGTRCSLQFVAQSLRAASAYRDAALAWVRRFEKRFSRFIETSLIGRINASAGRAPVPIDAEAARLFDLADSVVRLSGGLIDPSSLPLTLLWKQAAQEGRAPSPAAILRARNLTGWSRVQRQDDAVFLPEPGMSIDFGGFGKEYAVDETSALANRYGIHALLVDFGGDARGFGRPPDAPFWVAGIEEGDAPGKALKRVALRDGAVASSGNYLRYVEIAGRRYGHILDPRSGCPADNGLLAVSVLAPTCVEAGLLSTSAFLLGGEDGAALIDAAFHAEGCLQEPGRIRQTRFFHQYEIPD